MLTFSLRDHHKLPYFPCSAAVLHFPPVEVHSLYPCDTWRKLRSPSCHHLASAEAMFDIAWIQGVTRFHLSTNLETGFHRLKMHQKGQNNGRVPWIRGTCVTDSSNKLQSRKLPSLNRSFKPYSQKTIPAFLSHVSRARFIILNQAEVTKHSRKPLPKLDASKNPFGLLMKGQEPLETLQGFLCGCIVQQRPLQYSRQSVNTIQKGKSWEFLTSSYKGPLWWTHGLFRGLMINDSKNAQEPRGLGSSSSYPHCFFWGVCPPVLILSHQNLGRVALRFQDLNHPSMKSAEAKTGTKIAYPSQTFTKCITVIQCPCAKMSQINAFPGWLRPSNCCSATIHFGFLQKCAVHDRDTNRKHMHSCRDIAPGTQGSTMLLVCNLSPFLAPHPLISFWLVTGDIQKASNTTPHKENASHKNNQTSILTAFWWPTRDCNVFFKGSFIFGCYKTGVWGGRSHQAPPGVTCWSVTKNLDILSPRSHGKNPDQCILLCPHVNNNTPHVYHNFEIFVSGQLYDTVTFIGLMNFFDFQDVYVTALMPTTYPWQHWLQRPPVTQVLLPWIRSK